MRLTHFSLLLIVLCGFLILVVAGADKKKPEPSPKTPAATAAPKPEPKVFASQKAEKEAEAAVTESAKRFVAAFNKHDAKAVAAGFTANAEFITENRDVLRGRDAIEKHFAAAFAQAPKSVGKIHVETARLITSNVAVEEGVVELIPYPGAPAERSQYTALHLFQDGQWLLARARDFAAEPEVQSNHERLAELEWLVGEWMEEGEDTLVATACKWSNDKSYLLQDFTIRLGGVPPTTGSTRIGWDPLTQQIKSWTFDSDGGYSEALWTRGKDKWVLKSKGVTHLGRNYSMTSILRHPDAGTLSWETRDRVEGGILIPDRPPLLVKRRPPAPGE